MRLTMPKKAETEQITIRDLARRIVAGLRAHGARVINRSGEEMRPMDVEALVKEFFR
jgi:hypothetical protein